MHKKVILLVPLTFNDGTRVSQDILDEIYNDLFVLYGGYTLAGTVKGAYRMQSGAKQVDDSQEVWISVEKKELQGLRKLVGQFCSRLGQETIYFEVTGAKVEFIKPESDEGSTNGEEG